MSTLNALGLPPEGNIVAEGGDGADGTVGLIAAALSFARRHLRQSRRTCAAERHLVDRQTYKQHRSAVLAERQEVVGWRRAFPSGNRARWKLVLIRLTLHLCTLRHEPCFEHINPKRIDRNIRSIGAEYIGQ